MREGGSPTIKKYKMIDSLKYSFIENLLNTILKEKEI